jgi:hypothetical protein
MALRQPRYSKEEFARRGDAVDEAQVRCQIEPGNHGKIVAIDLETGDFEVDPSEIAACDRLGLAIPLLKLDGSYWFSPCSKIWWTHSQTCMMTGVVNAALESLIPLLICRSDGKILASTRLWIRVLMVGFLCLQM